MNKSAVITSKKRTVGNASLRFVNRPEFFEFDGARGYAERGTEKGGATHNDRADTQVRPYGIPHALRVAEVSVCGCGGGVRAGWIDELRIGILL